MSGNQRPDFLEMARAWLVRAQGHARPEHEKSLASELERLWELGIANAIEAADAVARSPGVGQDINDAIDAMTALTEKPPDPRGN